MIQIIYTETNSDKKYLDLRRTDKNSILNTNGKFVSISQLSKIVLNHHVPTGTESVS